MLPCVTKVAASPEKNSNNYWGGGHYSCCYKSETQYDFARWLEMNQRNVISEAGKVFCQ